MSLFKNLFDSLSKNPSNKNGLIDYGNEKKGGGHDHRSNRGEDRTPAQKIGDKARRKDS